MAGRKLGVACWSRRPRHHFHDGPQACAGRADRSWTFVAAGVSL